MDRFDRYLFRVFLRYLAVLGGSLLGTFAVLDLLGKGEELGQVGAPLGELAGEVVRYLGLNLPFVWLEFAPYLTLLAGLASALHLARRGEWTPVLTSGRAALRAVAPLLFGALVLGQLASAVREVAAPRLAAPRAALAERLFHQRPWQMADLAARSRDDVRLLAGLFLPDAAELRSLEVYTHDRDGEDLLLLADRARWQDGAWSLEGGRWIRPGRAAEPAASFAHAELTPADLMRAFLAVESPLELSSAELAEVLARDPRHRQAATLLWAWRAAPFSHFVLLLLGLPFVLRFDRRSAWEGFGLGMLLSLLYFVADILLRDLGGRGAVPPWLGGSGALLLFAAVALARWRGPGRPG